MDAVLSDQSYQLFQKTVKRLVFVLIFSLTSLDAQSVPPEHKPNPYWEARRKARENKGNDTIQKQRDAWDERHKPSLKEQLKQKLSNVKEFFSPTEDIYTFPGVVTRGPQGWQGSDNLYNIGKNIAVTAEFHVPDEKTFAVSKQSVIRRIEELFKDGDINPQASVVLGKPPLPLLNVIIIAQPIDKGYAVLVSGNLLEEVDLKRVQFKEGTWQAVTWQRDYLLVTSSEEAAYHISRSIDELAYSFIKLYRHYRDLQPRQF